MASGSIKVPFDTSVAAAANKRSFLMLRVTRECIEKRREAHAKLIQQKKRLPRIINKICANPTNPAEDCFAMTLEVERSFYAPKMIKQPVLDVAIANRRQCSAPIQHEVCVEHGKIDEAVQFYKAAFEAEVLEFEQGKSGVIRICSNHFSISEFDEEPSSRNSGLYYLLTDDVDCAVEKAVKAGASVLGKIVRLYSTCQIWCSLMRLIDPYDNIWIIYSKLCPSCLQTFAMLA